MRHWVICNRYYLNHYTISVHALKEPYNKLEQFNQLLGSIGIKLNSSGGVIKTSADGLLLQSSTVAPVNEVEFAGGEKMAIAGSYSEICRATCTAPQFAHLDDKEFQESTVVMDLKRTMQIRSSRARIQIRSTNEFLLQFIYNSLQKVAASARERFFSEQLKQTQLPVSPSL